VSARLWVAALSLAAASNGGSGAANTPEDPALSLDRGPGAPALELQRAEKLTYLVEVDIGPFRGIDVGEAVFSTKVEGEGDDATGEFIATFKASHLGYKLDHTLRSRHSKSGQIVLESSDIQRGSENRQRLITVERVDGGHFSTYRFDGHCGGCEDKAHFHKHLPWEKPRHCSGCDKAEHRVWREPRRRAVPEYSLDFLSSIYLIRAFISAGLEGGKTPLLEKDRLWELSMTRGKAKVVEVPKGRYACQKIIIEAERPKTETHEGKFSGLFGMKGSMSFWVHESTGVMVQIVGELPFGLSVKIRLKGAEGTPEGLLPEGG